MVNLEKSPIAVDYPTATTYVRETCLAIWHNAVGLLLVGFIFCLVSLPTFWFIQHDLPEIGAILAIILVAPAWLAVLAYVGGVLQRNEMGMGSLPRLFFRYYLRGILLGSVFCIPLVSTFWCAPVLLVSVGNPVIWLFLITGIIVLAILATLFVYAPSLMVLYDLGLPIALRNALILSGRHTWNTLGMLGMGVLCAMAVLYISSGLAFFLPAIWGMFLANNCRMVVLEELRNNR